MNLNKNHKEFMLGALLGGTVGTAAALLLTPVSGNQLRHKVAKGVGKINGASKTIRAAVARPLTAKKKRKPPTSRKTSKPAHKPARHKTAA